MNHIYFVETEPGQTEPKSLCERHAGQEGRVKAISERMDETEQPCGLCFEEDKEVLLEAATNIIGTEGEGMLTFFGLLAGLLEARAEANDEYSHVFHTGLDGVRRTLDNLLEIEFDKFDEGDEVVFTGNVERASFAVPAGTKGVITRISAACVIIKFDPTGIFEDAACNTVMFDRDEPRFKETFLHSVSKS